MSKFNKEYDSLIKESRNKPFTKVVSKYIFFLDDLEVYQLSPYKLIGDVTALAKIKTDWKRVNVATGEDISEMVPGSVIDIPTEGGKWFVVDGSFPGREGTHSFPALISA
jgi:hypothetical protein